MIAETQDRSDYALRFQSLFDAGRGYTFPCDAAGHVDMNQLSTRGLCNYLYARAVVGREFQMPCIERHEDRQWTDRPAR